ncbi:hypothetical protein Tco_0328285 [Tanacetum coccineum]
MWICKPHKSNSGSKRSSQMLWKPMVLYYHFGEEKQLILKCRVDEILKGYPEVAKKWAFGDKEFMVPKAARSSLFHGWKMWRDEATKDLKTNTTNDVSLVVGLDVTKFVNNKLLLIMGFSNIGLYKPVEAFKTDLEGSPPEATYERCKSQYVNLAKSLLRPLLSATIVNPTKDEDTVMVQAPAVSQPGMKRSQEDVSQSGNHMMTYHCAGNTTLLHIRAKSVQKKLS